MGKFLAILIVAAAVIGGAGVYYMQEYAFYRKVPATGARDVELTPQEAPAPEPLAHAAFSAIDADSSPIRYRACFTTPVPLAELAARYRPYPGAEPLEGPRWFDCFDADEIGAALAEGRALAPLGQQNVSYGIDRVVAVLPDGRGFAWHQINRCGKEVFDGRPAPEGCPPPPAAPIRR